MGAVRGRALFFLLGELVESSRTKSEPPGPQLRGALALVSVNGGGGGGTCEKWRGEGGETRPNEQQGKASNEVPASASFNKACCSQRWC